MAWQFFSGVIWLSALTKKQLNSQGHIIIFIKKTDLNSGKLTLNGLKICGLQRIFVSWLLCFSSPFSLSLSHSLSVSFFLSFYIFPLSTSFSLSPSLSQNKTQHGLMRGLLSQTFLTFGPSPSTYSSFVFLSPSPPLSLSLSLPPSLFYLFY